MSIDRASLDPTTRRAFLERSGLGFGQLALSALLASDSGRAAADRQSAGAKDTAASGDRQERDLPVHARRPEPPRHLRSEAAARQAQWPARSGQLRDRAASVFEVQGSAAACLGPNLPKYGQAGIEISDMFPSVAQHADDLAVIRSCYHDGFTHTAALNWLNNGWPRLGRPSVGSWVVYGLGSESDSLPAFVVLLDGGIKSGPVVYSSGFLPAVYQGTVLRNGSTPILNAQAAREHGGRRAARMLDTLRWFNEQHLRAAQRRLELAARIASYELAFRMQMAAPELTDLSKETAATRALYGLDEAQTSDFGGKCLMARRLVERGVRFIQALVRRHDGGGDWDGHAHCDKIIRRSPPRWTSRSPACWRI